jgi:hypothetical protein
MNRFAAARPMPVAPPVMTATLPSSLFMMFYFSFLLDSVPVSLCANAPYVVED